MDIAGLVRALYDIRQQKSALEKTEKAILGELKPLVDPQFDESQVEEEGKTVSLPIVVGSLSLSRVLGTSRAISRDLLLERGVAPDIIQSATKTTTYFQYRVKGAGEK